MAQAADRFGRREALGLLSLGAVAVSSSLARAQTASQAPLTEGDAEGPDPAIEPDPWALVAPLEAGAALGTVLLVGMSSITRTGTVDVEFETEQEERFQARICRRDDAPGAPTPIARTGYYDLFLSNQGNGDKPTNEHHGVTVMALAAVVRQNEQALERLAVGTMRQRWQRLAVGARGASQARTT